MSNIILLNKNRLINTVYILYIMDPVVVDLPISITHTLLVQLSCHEF